MIPNKEAKMDRTLVMEFDDFVEYRLSNSMLNQAFSAIGRHSFGNEPVNIVAADGKYVENPRIVNHQNSESHRVAACRFSGSKLIPVSVKVYSDGSIDLQVKPK